MFGEPFPELPSQLLSAAKGSTPPRRFARGFARTRQSKETARHNWVASPGFEPDRFIAHPVQASPAWDLFGDACDDMV